MKITNKTFVVLALCFVISQLLFLFPPPILAQEDIVNIVKNGKIDKYPYATLGEAIDRSLQNPKWTVIRDRDGTPYVNISSDDIQLQYRVFTDKRAFKIQGLKIYGIYEGIDKLDKLYRSLFWPFDYDGQARSTLQSASFAMEAYFEVKKTYIGLDPLSDYKQYGHFIQDFLQEGGVLRVISVSQSHYLMESFHKKGRKKYIVSGPGMKIREQ